MAIYVSPDPSISCCDRNLSPPGGFEPLTNDLVDVFECVVETLRDVLYIIGNSIVVRETARLLDCCSQTSQGRADGEALGDESRDINVVVGNVREEFVQACSYILSGLGYC